MARRIVGVIGAGECDTTVSGIAEEVGRRLAECQYVVLTGGRTGVMEAASRGAKQAGGLTVGILPGNSPQDANPHVDIPIATGLQDARNAIVARASEILIAIAGEYGTLSEIALALKMGRRVIGLGTWHLAKAVQAVETPQQAVANVVRYFETH
ncbi:TIGR00725 family protein [Candidatus Entotheonella serta]|nr:TIGR00725 family protein [Candidatus Entotheonella serta]